MNMKISIIVPCYNEQDVLLIFYQEISGVLKSLDYEYELIFVNDGSKDKTLDVLKALASNDTKVKNL